jgi:HAD superfamily hydrolase (TIGR01549 family)
VLKAVLFDYNGVLVSDLHVHEEAYIRAAEEFGLSLRPEVFRRHFSASPEQKKTLLFGRIPDETWKNLFQTKTNYYFESAKKRNLLVPGVEQVLVSLAEHYFLGLVTNTPRVYFETIFPRALARLFREKIFSDETTNPKPSPEPLLEVVRRMKLRTDQCCYIGDSVSDILMARRAGVRIFAVTTGDGSREELKSAGPDGILESLSELKEMLRAVANLCRD